MKKMISVLIVIVFLTVSSAFAESKSGIILKGTAYGAVIGGLVGASVWILTDIDDNFDYTLKGAAVGALAGTAYGFYEAESFATIENGKIKFAMPTIKTKSYYNSPDVRTSADLVKVNF